VTQMADWKKRTQPFFDRQTLYSLVPVALWFLWLILFVKDYPFGDDWTLLKFYDQYVNGNLTFSHVWQQHNEHRIVFPKLIIILLQALSHYAIYPVIILNIVLAAASFLILGHHVAKAYPMSGVHKGLLYAVLGLILFSMNQYEAVFWGVCLSWYMNTFLAMLGFYVASTIEKDSYPLLFVIFLCGVGTLFSSGNGLLYWPVVAAILAVKRFVRKEIGTRFALVWVPLSLAAILAYFVDYHKQPHPMGVSGREVVVIAGAFLNFLGAPVVSFNNKITLLAGPVVGQKGLVAHLLPLSAAVAGGAGLSLFLKFVWDDIRAKRLDLFLVAVVSYVLLTGLLISVSRVIIFKSLGMGVTSASRYMTISCYFWAVLLIRLFAGLGETRAPAAYRWIIVLVVLSSLVSYGHSSMGFLKNKYFLVKTVTEDIKTDTFSEQVSRIIGNEAEFRRGVRIMKENKLSVFRQ
jgi:hypothetical protein